MLIHFEKDNTISKKVVVTAIWLFSIATLVLLLTIAYQEVNSEQLTYRATMAGILGGVASGILVVFGLLSRSGTARRAILLIAYIVLLSPFIMYVMLRLFVPNTYEEFWTIFIVPNIIVSIFIIILLSNKVSLQLYSLRKNTKLRIKEQLYLLLLSISLIGLYTYFIYIPNLFI